MHTWGNKVLPGCTKEYNMYMRAVDKCNSLCSYYLLHLTHYFLWYMSITYYCLDMLLINSFVFFKYSTGKRISQKEYRLELLRLLLDKKQVGYSTPFHGLVVKTKKSRHSKSNTSSSPSLVGRMCLRIGSNEGSLKYINQRYPTRMMNVGDHSIQTITKGRSNCNLCYLMG